MKKKKDRSIKIATYKTLAEIKRENPPREGDDEVLTGQEACAILGSPSTTLKNLRDKKEIGCIIISPGTYRYYRKRHIEAFLKRREKPAR